ncbi:alpha/beta hydrolase fold domain-containing protein [Modestobacter roseus]|uniref:Acetyl esterase/lipase n=1 Tax=Modestobacter roseus TaxID=1181884 RepID=A0A562IS70_9ACTN|nr:alpha/beta hydrolase fold domain-containing protein [Modestobacter roseus]MQA35104.1 alpha/beta hydrolase fold domain-containing protein [Modestobacter roseus]TWH73666.1 acetyl esterase/lipase [Modestobacter roseus]
MSQQQRDTIDQVLRHSGLDLGGEVAEQRRRYREMMSAIPLPGDVRTEDAALGGVPVVVVTVDDVPATSTILYFHGGAYAIGAAALSVGLASGVARAAGARTVSVEYSLAPEAPHPAATDDAVAAYRGLLEDGVPAGAVVLAGESAGGGLALAAAVAIRAAGLPAPAAVYLVSPWVDLTLSGESIVTKAPVDPSVDPAGLGRRALDYGGGHDLGDGRLSPLFADLTGLPPLLLQVGGNEVLLDDSTRLAARAAAAGVQVTLQVTPGVPHVFVGFAGMLDEADRALAEAGRFLATHLAG